MTTDPFARPGAQRWLRPLLTRVPVANAVTADTDVGELLLHADDRVMTPWILERSHWEPAEAAWLRGTLKPGQTAIDVGANVGYFTLLMSQAVGTHGHVIAVEPEADNLRLLRRNLLLNRAFNARVVPGAAWHERAQLALRHNALNRGDHQTHPATADGHALVPAFALDDLIDRPVDTIKIDTQGADHYVIRGLARTLEANPAACVLVEFWMDSMGEREVSAIDILASYRALDRPIGLLDEQGAVTLAGDDEIISVAAAAQDHWVNLVLSGRETPLGWPAMGNRSEASGQQTPSAPPVPPPALAVRTGGTFEEYSAIGAAQRAWILQALPSEWSWDGKHVLDFGCGTGRTIAAFSEESAVAAFWGCDIHAISIEWAQRNLDDRYTFFTCGERPPLDQPSELFDLVYACSVFTHLTDEWSSWLLEMHRVLRPGGLAVFSVLNAGMSSWSVGKDWDDRIGMAVANLGRDFDHGGPDVLLSEWWVREHWGRAFEILSFIPYAERGKDGVAVGHGFVCMRRRDVSLERGDLEASDLTDPQEVGALQFGYELLREQAVATGARAQHLEDERNQLRGEVAHWRTAFEAEQAKRAVVEGSKSWQITSPMRRLARALRERG